MDNPFELARFQAYSDNPKQITTELDEAEGAIITDKNTDNLFYIASFIKFAYSKQSGVDNYDPL